MAAMSPSLTVVVCPDFFVLAMISPQMWQCQNQLAHDSLHEKRLAKKVVTFVESSKLISKLPNWDNLGKAIKQGGNFLTPIDSRVTYFCRT